MSSLPDPSPGREPGSSVSIVVPVYNSAHLIATCHAALAAVADNLPGEVEIIYVDDGSRDRTLDALKAVQANDARVRIVELAGNFGQPAAIFAAIAHARGAHLATIDVDLQCDPRDIPRVLAPLRRGYDLVSGVRTQRHDPYVRRFVSRVVRWLIGPLTGVSLRDPGCGLNALTRELAASMARFGDIGRFPKPLAARLASRIAEVEVTHVPSPRGSSYSVAALAQSFMSLLASSLGNVRAWVFLVASCAALILAAATVVSIILAIAGGLTLMVSLICGVLLVAAGLTARAALAGDYLQRIQQQASGMPMYLVRRIHERAAT